MDRGWEKQLKELRKAINIGEFVEETRRYLSSNPSPLTPFNRGARKFVEGWDMMMRAIPKRK